MEDALSDRTATTHYRHRVRIYWEDTDASGIVYHANYLKYAERARTEWLRVAGGRQSELLASAGIALVVRRATLDFQRPARLDDLLEVVTRPVAVTGATVSFDQEVILAEDASEPTKMAKGSDLGAVRPRLVTVCVQLACVDRQGRAVRLPASFRETMIGVLRPDQQGVFQ